MPELNKGMHLFHQIKSFLVLFFQFADYMLTLKVRECCFFSGDENVLYLVLVTGCVSVGKIGDSEIFSITATQFVSLQNLPNDEERIVGVRSVFNSRTFYFAWASTGVPWDLTLCAQRKIQDHDTDNRFFWLIFIIFCHLPRWADT